MGLFVRSPVWAHQHWKKGDPLPISYLPHKILINRLPRTWISINLKLNQARKAIQNNHKSQIIFLWCILHAKQLEDIITQSDCAKVKEWRNWELWLESSRLMLTVCHHQILWTNWQMAVGARSRGKLWPLFWPLWAVSKCHKGIKWSTNHYRPWLWVKETIVGATRIPGLLTQREKKHVCSWWMNLWCDMAWFIPSTHLREGG